MGKRYLTLLILFLGACSTEDNSEPAMDCRQERFACSADFACLQDDSGAYECQAVDRSDQLLDSGIDATSVTATNDAQSTMVDANQEQDSTSTEPADATITAADAEPSDAGSAVMLTPGEPYLLSNTPEVCDRIGLIAPVLPREANHRAATVLTPPQYPFAITSLEYELITAEDTPTCNGAIAHSLELMILPNGDALPRRPDELGRGYRQYSIPTNFAGRAGQLIELTLPAPLLIESDNQLVVSVELAAQDGEHLCVSSCLDADAPAGTDWWSNAAEAPFDWQDLVVDYQLKGALRIRAIGHLVEER